MLAKETGDAGNGTRNHGRSSARRVLLHSVVGARNFDFIYELAEDNYSVKTDRFNMDIAMLVKIMPIQFLCGSQSMWQAVRVYLPQHQPKLPHLYSLPAREYHRRCLPITTVIYINYSGSCSREFFSLKKDKFNWTMYNELGFQFWDPDNYSAITDRYAIGIYDLPHFAKCWSHTMHSQMGGGTHAA